MSRSEITLKVLRDFQCLADDCPDNCCTHGWDIRVDQATLKKWEGLSDVNFREKILSNLTERESHGVKETFIGGDGKRCSLMDENGLCTIHATLGEEYLGETCKTYPRMAKPFSRYILNSAVMSCPEVARMIVESKDKNMFVSDGELDVYEEHTYCINEFVSKVLNKNNYLLSSRVITISRFLYTIAGMSQRGELSLAILNAISKKITKPLKEAERDIKSKRIKIDNQIVGKFWSIVYKIINKGVLVNSEVVISQHPIVAQLDAADHSPESYDELYKHITKLKNNAKPILSKIIDDIGSKYLQVKFQAVGFPLDPPGENYIAAFLFGVLPYCYINMCLWIIYDQKKSIAKNDVIDVIYRTERIVQHTDRIYDIIVSNQQILHINEFESCFADLV